MVVSTPTASHAISRFEDMKALARHPFMATAKAMVPLHFWGKVALCFRYARNRGLTQSSMLGSIVVMMMYWKAGMVLVHEKQLL